MADDETGAIPDHIDHSKLNAWFFNEDTLEKMPQQIIEHGIKVEGGDCKQRTIFEKDSEIY